MQTTFLRSLWRLGYLQWLLGGLVLGLLGVSAAWLSHSIVLALLSAALFVGALLMRPRWVLIILLLLRSSADVAQSLFVLFPGSWYSLNVAGALNILAVGIGCVLIVRRYARGQAWLPSAPLQFYAIFLICAAIGITQSIDPGLSIKEWSRLAGSIGIALLVLEVVQSEKDLVTVLRVVTVAALPPLLLGYYQAATGTGYYFEGWQGTLFAFRPQGTFGHPATLASFMVLVSSLALASFANAYPLWSRFSLLALAGASLGLLLLTFSRTEWIGGMLALGLLALLRYRRLLVVGSVVVLIVVLTMPGVQARLRGENASESFDWRVEVWDASLILLRQPTLIGSGLDTSPILINKQLPRVFTPPHNDYLKLAIETGLAGLAIFGLLQVSLLGLGWRAFRDPTPSRSLLGLTLLIVTAAGLVISLADNYIGYTSVQWYYWTIVALCVSTFTGFKPPYARLVSS